MHVPNYPQKLQRKAGLLYVLVGVWRGRRNCRGTVVHGRHTPPQVQTAGNSPLSQSTRTSLTHTGREQRIEKAYPNSLECPGHFSKHH